MTTWKLLLTTWEFTPSVVVGCALILVFYFWKAHWKVNRKAINFTLGVLVIFLALCSPIDPLGDDYLFSAHMVQHMMLGMIAPVLMVAGIPESFVRAWLKIPIIAWLERLFSNPQLALILASFTFWIWHLPSLYDLTLDNELIHIIEHMLLIITGTMLWWPVFKPIPEGRMKPLPALLYMGVAAASSTVLGIIFTISDTPYYQGYAHPHDELGALQLIRDGWGLNQLEDQKLGGAIMWEPAGAIFLWAMIVIFIEWLREEGRETNVGAE